MFKMEYYPLTKNLPDQRQIQKYPGHHEPKAGRILGSALP
jgi:hypothetical protein